MEYSEYKYTFINTSHEVISLALINGEINAPSPNSIFSES